MASLSVGFLGFGIGALCLLRRRQHHGSSRQTYQGAEKDEMCEVIDGLKRSIPLALTSFGRVCDLLMVHRSTKDADIVQRAGTMMSHLFEEAAIVIEALATAVLVHSCCKWHTTPERHCCTVRHQACQLYQLLESLR